MKSQHVTAGLVFLALGISQPAFAGNVEEMEKCTNAIMTLSEGRPAKATVTVGGTKFTCAGAIIVSGDPTKRGMGTFAPNNAYFEGHFVRVNRVIANDLVRFYITVENYENGSACTIAEPMVKIERKSRLVRIGGWLPNWKDWKSLPAKIDGNWEAAAIWLSAAAIAKWHQTNFSHCKRNW